MMMNKHKLVLLAAAMCLAACQQTAEPTEQNVVDSNASSTPEAAAAIDVANSAAASNVSEAKPEAAAGSADSKLLVGTWFIEEETCESDNGVTYSADGTWGAYGVEGTWRLEGQQLITIITAQGEGPEDMAPVKAAAPHNETIRFEGKDKLVSVWADKSTHRLKRCG
jgi:hypothetical protein